MGRCVTGKNDLYTWCIENDNYGQKIISEWIGKDEDEKYVDMHSIGYGSHKQVFWKCSNNHTYLQMIYAHVKGQGCPYCSAGGTSYPEQFIYWALKQIYPQTISRGKYQGIEFDITIPEERTCIEYSPTYWHEDKIEYDNQKADICKEHNMRFIYIREDSYKEYTEKWEKDYVCFHMIQTKKNEYCTKLVEHIIKSLGHSISEISIDLVKKNAFEYSHGKVLKEYSLSNEKYSELIKEINQNIDIDNTLSSSNEKCIWKCIKCNKEFTASISSRTYEKTGCPYCGYNWTDKKIHKHAIQKATVGVNDLQTIFPLLCKEWSTKNKLSPSHYQCGSGFRAKWLCTQCGYEWEATINNRVSHKQGCPNCGFNWDAKGYKKDQKEYSLGYKYPMLCIEISDLDNVNVTQISPYSTDIIKWRCPRCKHTWDAQIVSRIRGRSGCPNCHYNWYKEQTKQTNRHIKENNNNVETN